VAAPAANITAPETVVAGASALQASVTAQAGMTYAWTITGGAITGGLTGAGVSFTAGPVGTLVLSCTVTNLAGATASGSREVQVQPAPPAPTIQSWTASRAILTVRQPATLTATFSNGSGTVDQGVGPVTSGVPFTTGPMMTATTFTLTVTGAGAPATASVTVGVVIPPSMVPFDQISRVVATGTSGFLWAAYSTDPAGSVTIDHGVGSLPNVASIVVPTGPLTTTTTFTLSVQNSADSVITDTATVVVQPGAPGTFTPAGAGTPRQWFSATRLVDGRVLLLGGFASPADLRSAELYNPVTNTFSPTGDMNVERSFPQAVRLQDGRVLVISPGTSAEIYDPASGIFSLTGPMTQARSSVMHLLPDGRVLLVGGGSIPESAEVFNPSTGTFSLTGSLVNRHFDILSSRLLDGRVLVAGGTSGAGTKAEVYNPSTGTFTSVGDMALAHSGGTATLLPDGRVLIAGGLPNLTDPEHPMAEVFDPVTNQFSAAGNMAVPRSDHTATLRSDGTVLIVGGRHARLNFVMASEVFDPATGEFRPATPVMRARWNHAAVETGMGSVTVFGGSDSSGDVIAEAERFQ
jgi:hypothetical protein